MVLRRRPGAGLLQRFYDCLGALLNRDYQEVRFLNFGYHRENDGWQVSGLTEKERLQRHQAHLYHAVAAPAGVGPPTDLDVLETGSGRGGGLAYIHRFFRPHRSVGIDFSATAVDFCKQTYTGECPDFIRADAAAIPFADRSFDRILCIETAHCLPAATLLQECSRVLRPGGLLLMADLVSPQRVPSLESAMLRAGLQIREREDITLDVLRSLERDDARKIAYLNRTRGSAVFRFFYRTFMGCQGTAGFDQFALGRRVYLRWVLAREEAGSRITPTSLDKSG